MSGFILIYSKNETSREELKRLSSSMMKRLSPFVLTRRKEYYDDRVGMNYFGDLEWEDLDSDFVNTEELLVCLSGYVLSYRCDIGEMENSRKQTFETDAEKLIWLYKRFGPDFISNVNGIFTIIIYDKSKNELIVSTDRYGYGNPYYANKNNYLLASTEFKCISDSGLVNKSIDHQAIYDLHLFHFIVDDKTFLKEIKLFPHGRTLVANSNRVKWVQYWDYSRDKEIVGKDLNKTTEEALYHIENSIKRIVAKKTEKLSVSLSGGMDSRMIAGMLYRLGNRAPLFNFGDGRAEETEIARSVSRTLEGDFKLFDWKSSRSYARIIEDACEFTDCQYSPDQFILYDFARFMSQASPQTVVLHGLGMDVLFRIQTSLAYEGHKPKESYDGRDKQEMLEMGFLFTGKFLITKVFRKEVSEEILKMRSILEEIEKFPTNDLQNLYEYFYFNNRGRRYVLGSPYSHRRFCQYRFPGMDYDLFDFGVKLPKDLRWQTVLYRRIFVHYFEELAKIPYNYTGVPLDQWRIKKKKGLRVTIPHYLNRLSHGILNLNVPYFGFDRHYRKDREFRKFADSILLEKRSVDRGFYTSESMDRFLKEIRAGKNYFGLAATILGVELFFRKHVD